MDKVQISRIRVAHYQVWPEMAVETFEQLVADVKKNGVTYPIIVDENYVILDGHHRYKAAKIAGLSSIDCIVRKGLSEEDKLEIAHKTNTTTRSLTTADKKRRALELREERRSYRQIAAWLGVGKSTVERWLRGVPSGTNTVIGNDGKEYLSKKPRTSQQEYVEGLRSQIAELESEVYRIKEEKRKLEREIKGKDIEIESLKRQLGNERAFRSIFGGGRDNGLKVFAAVVGLNENASVEDIKLAFRDARRNAHPDRYNADWVSARFNVCYDEFRKMYAS